MSNLRNPVLGVFKQVLKANKDFSLIAKVEIGADFDVPQLDRIEGAFSDGISLVDLPGPIQKRFKTHVLDRALVIRIFMQGKQP